MDEPKPLFAMSPGRKWCFRLLIVLMWALVLIGLATKNQSVVRPSGSVFYGVLAVALSAWFVEGWRAVARGAKLPLPDEYDPARYPLEQRGRARMNWPACVLVWGFTAAIGVFILNGLLRS